MTTEEPTPLARRCAAIELLVLDVDGVLTGGGITYADGGVEVKSFHVRDGAALKWWAQVGKRAAIISGRTSRAVQARAAELGLDLVYQGAADKLAAYRQVLEATGLAPGQAACVGDDLPDLPLLRNCGLAVAVADACPEVAADAHFVTGRPGGAGAVREAVELILRGQGKWQAIVAGYRAQRLPGGAAAGPP